MKIRKQNVTKQDFVVLLLAFVTSSVSWIANIGE